MLTQFTTSSTGQPFITYLLKPKDIPNFLELHNKQDSVKPRTAQDLKAHLDADMPIIGVKFAGTGQHIAHMLLTNPESKIVQNTNNYPEYENTALIQSVVIDKNYNSQKLSTIFNGSEGMAKPQDLLFQQARQCALEDGFDYLMAKVKSSNDRSIRLFERRGFEIQQSYIADGENYEAHYLTSPVLNIAPNLTPKQQTALVASV